MKPNNTCLTILREARNILSDSSKWTKGVYARDSHSIPVDILSQHATCFCLGGAVTRAKDKLEVSSTFACGCLVLRVIKRRSDFKNINSIFEFNDSPQTKYEDVIAVIDESIKEVEMSNCNSNPSIPVPVKEAIDRYAKQHKLTTEEHVNLLSPANLRWDSLNKCFFFWRNGVYHGVEVDGYLHT